MSRYWGIVSDQTGLSAGILLNTADDNQSVDIAEARGTDGKIIQLKAYSRNNAVNLSGLMDSEKGNVARAGASLTFGGKTWIIESVQKQESNTDWVRLSISARTADNATITPLDDSSSSSSAQQ